MATQALAGRPPFRAQRVAGSMRVLAYLEFSRATAGCRAIDERDFGCSSEPARPSHLSARAMSWYRVRSDCVQRMDMIVIASADAKQSTADAAPARCVSAKSLISKATDAMTQMTQKSGSHPCGCFLEAGRGSVTERASGRRDRKTAIPTATALPIRRVRSGHRGVVQLIARTRRRRLAARLDDREKGLDLFHRAAPRFDLVSMGIWGPRFHPAG